MNCLLLFFQSMIGHGLGAAGGLEAIATIKAITTGWIHPTINQYVLHLTSHFSTLYAGISSLSVFLFFSLIPIVFYWTSH